VRSFSTLQTEIERVKKRRIDREEEKAAQEEEKELMMREVALAEAVQLEKKVRNATPLDR
jgi:hypothetical protein